MFKPRIFASLFLAVVFAVPVFGQNIVTVAGGGPNNLPALSANLDGPSGVAVDASGNFYVAIFDRVFRVDGNGALTSLAGIGSGFSGSTADGIPATSAFICVEGMTVDRTGNVFIADGCTIRVRRVDATTGIITTVVGNGTAGFSGDGGPATSAELYDPEALAVDSAGNLFIQDKGGAPANDRIRRVDPATQIITTFANMSASGMAVDSAGNLFVSDENKEFVYRLDRTSGAASTYAGNGFHSVFPPNLGGFSGDGGPATSAELNHPTGLAVDGQGNLFIADKFNNCIRRVDAATQIITTVAGRGSGGDGGPATSAFLGSPIAVAADGAGSLFIVQLNEETVRHVDAATQVISTSAGNGSCCVTSDGVAAGSAGIQVGGFAQGIQTAGGIALDSAGDMFVSGGYLVRRVDSATNKISTVAGSELPQNPGEGGPATSAELYPGGLSFDTSGDLFIADTVLSLVRRVDANSQVISTVAGTLSETCLPCGGFGGDGGSATSAELDQPNGITFDGRGNLLLADLGNERIRRVDGATRVITTVAGNGTAGFAGDGGPATSAELNEPSSVTVDSAGNLFIADDLNNRVRRVDATTGTITTVAGNGTAGFSGDGGPATSAELNEPSSVALDGGGNIFIADYLNNRVRRVDATTGTITTVAGNGTAGFSGDGGPATAAELAGPSWVALDNGGNLFISDADNLRIREVIFHKKSQTTSFAAIPNRIFISGDSFTVSATASSSLPVTLTVGRADSCTLSGTTVQITGVGSCTVTAHQVGNDFYDAAADAPQSFRILYAPAGQACDGNPGHAILPPINADGTTVAKRGSTVPAKFRVCDGNGNSVGTAGVVTSFKLVGISSGTRGMQVNTPVNWAKPDSQFRWDPVAQQWVFNISTSGLAGGKTYVYGILLNDGTSIGFQFGLK